MNEREVTQKVFKCIPAESISLISANMPSNYLLKFLEYLSIEIDQGKDVEWNMQWLKNILKFQEATLNKYKQSGHGGRALLLKIYSSVQFFD